MPCPENNPLLFGDRFRPPPLMLPGVIGGQIGPPSQRPAKLRLTLKMVQPDIRIDGACIAQRLQLQAQIRVLKISDRIYFVETANLIREISPQHHASSSDADEVLQIVAAGVAQALILVLAEKPATILGQSFKIHTTMLHRAVH